MTTYHHHRHHQQQQQQQYAYPQWFENRNYQARGGERQPQLYSVQIGGGDIGGPSSLLQVHHSEQQQQQDQYDDDHHYQHHHHHGAVHHHNPNNNYNGNGCKPLLPRRRSPPKDGKLKFTNTRFYGRQQELDHLHRLFRGCQNTGPVSGYESTPIVFLSGHSGCGKTALITEFTNRMKMGSVPHVYMKGKYSDLRTADPFRAILDAISGWCHGATLKDPKTREILSKEIGTRIKSSIATQELDVLKDMIPGLNKLLVDAATSNNNNNHNDDTGSVCSLASRGTAASRRNLMRLSAAKLQYIFKSLIKALTSARRPLILFLDDLQWADPASLDLLKGLWLDTSQTNFFFIGAYRSDEVISRKDHPFLLIMDDLRTKRGGIDGMHLRELSCKNLAGFLQDSLELEPHEASELAGAVYNTTRGNIYHTMQAVEELIRKQVYCYDEMMQSWRWNLPNAQCQVDEVLSDSIMETINYKIERMPDLLKQALLIASYIRPTFDVGLLLYAMHTIGLHDVTQEELVHVLDGGIFEGLFVLTDDRKDDKQKQVYSFAHDSIQETARTLTSGEERRQMSIRLGLALSERGMDEEFGEDWMLFSAAQHWNTATAESLWPELEEDKLRLARLNQKIAEISLGLAAFEEAIAFLVAGIDALGDSLDPDEKWSPEFHKDCMQLHHLLMDVLYTSGKFDILEACIDDVLENAQSLHDKGPAFVHSLGIIMQAKDRDHGKAIAKGKEMLSLLGVTIDVDPENVQTEDIEQFELACRQALNGSKVLELLEYPLAEDDTVLCLLEQISRAAIYSGKMPFCYILGQVAIRICAEEQCISEYLPRIYMYSAMYFRKLDLYMMAYDCAATCKEMVDRIEGTSTEGYCKVTVTCNNALQLYRPCHMAVGVYKECYVKCMRAGDTEFASLVANSYGMSFFLSGAPITAKVDRKFELFESESRRYNQPPSVYSIFQVYRQLVASMQGKSNDPVIFDGDAMTEKDVLARFEKGTPQYKQTLRDLSVCKLMSAVIYKDLPAMEILLQTLKEWPDFDILLHRLHMRLVWVALAAAALARARRGKEYVEMNKKYLKFYEYNANQGNPNAKVILACLKAENDQKKVNYNAAIEVCQEHKFLHLEALMNENCGMYQRKRKKRVKAEPYITRAYELYQAYGATGKVRHMQRELE